MNRVLRTLERVKAEVLAWVVVILMRAPPNRCTSPTATTTSAGRDTAFAESQRNLTTSVDPQVLSDPSSSMTTPKTTQDEPPPDPANTPPAITSRVPAEKGPGSQSSAKGKSPNASNASNAKAAQSAQEEKKLTGKELKEQKKAEKAARRAQAKTAAPAGPAPSRSLDKQSTAKQQAQQSHPESHKGGPKKTTVQMTGNDGIVKTIYVTGNERPRAKETNKDSVSIVESVRDRGLVGLLKDIEGERNEKKKFHDYGIDHADQDVHAAILTLGMQINKRIISGSSARCMGFLLAIRRVIEDYQTPPGSSLNRHLPGAYLSHQINYLTSARPMGTPMGNAIRWLKTEISEISPDYSDEDAKGALLEKINSFIHEKFTAADDIIVKTACHSYISDGDVILTFSKSQVIEKVLLEAKRRGKRFRVIVVDNRPYLEGANLAASLSDVGIECSYVHLYALNYSIHESTKVFLGAHAIMANGALYSRAGNAAVALAAKSAGIPVIVCCETIKFSEKINIDGIVSNELGTADSLVDTSRNHNFPQLGSLSGWKQIGGTTVVDFLYDVTPPDALNIIVCEHGCTTPEGISALLKVGSTDR